MLESRANLFVNGIAAHWGGYIICVWCDIVALFQVAYIWYQGLIQQHKLGGTRASWLYLSGLEVGGGVGFEWGGVWLTRSKFVKVTDWINLLQQLSLSHRSKLFSDPSSSSRSPPLVWQSRSRLKTSHPKQSRQSRSMLKTSHPKPCICAAIHIY